MLRTCGNSKKGRDKNQYILPNYSTVSGRPASEILRGCAYRGPKNKSMQYDQHKHLVPIQ